MAAILLVDDDRVQARLLVRFLEAGGHAVTVAEDGHAGLAAARAQPPDLVLVDLVMPGMDGAELCRALSRDATLASLPIVIVSCVAYGEGDRERVSAVDRRGRKLDLPGAVAYLQKPVGADELLAVVRRHLRHASGG